MYVAGTSLGTAAALYAAAHRPVAGVFLRTPPPLRRLLLGHYGWWNLGIAAGVVAAQIPPELDSRHNAALATAPAVFLLADRDRVVPFRYQKAVVDAYGGQSRVVVMKGADHNSPVPDKAAGELASAMGWLCPAR